jgi:hypothetical protein
MRERSDLKTSFLRFAQDDSFMQEINDSGDLVIASCPTGILSANSLRTNSYPNWAAEPRVLAGTIGGPSLTRLRAHVLLERV